MIVCAKHLAEPAKGYHTCVGCEVESLRAEVERLKTERDTFRHGHSLASNRCCELEAEVERLRAAPAAGTEKDAELADVLNTTLWLYRRLPHTYGNPPFVDKAILTMAERLGLDDVPAAVKERANLASHVAAKDSPCGS